MIILEFCLLHLIVYVIEPILFFYYLNISSLFPNTWGNFTSIILKSGIFLCALVRWFYSIIVHNIYNMGPSLPIKRILTYPFCPSCHLPCFTSFWWSPRMPVAFFKKHKEGKIFWDFACVKVSLFSCWFVFWLGIKSLQNFRGIFPLSSSFQSCSSEPWAILIHHS